MRLAVTGHRPDKLGGYTLPVYERLTRFAQHQLNLLPAPPLMVYTGMALGWDLAVAFACYRNKVPFTACLPFEGQSSVWNDADRVWHGKLCAAAAEVVTVCPGGYAGWKMQKRNEYMVDHADLVLALHDGSPGGTGNCVRYAQAECVPVQNCWSQLAGFS